MHSQKYLSFKFYLGSTEDEYTIKYKEVSYGQVGYHITTRFHTV